MANRKGLHPLAWVGIGCAVLVVVGVAVVGFVAWRGSTWLWNKAESVAAEASANPVTFTAKAIALANPEIEFVSADEETQEVVFRHVEKGEEYRISFEDVKAGRIEFEGPDGTVEFESDAEAGGLTVRTDEGETRYGGAASGSELPDWLPIPPGATAQVQFAQSSGAQQAGAFQLEGIAGADAIAFYKQELEAAAFEVRSQELSGGGASLQSLTGTHGDGRQVSVVAQDGGIVVSFNSGS